MAAHGNGEDISRAQNMARLCDLHAVQAHMARFHQFSGLGALLDDTGKPKPLVQTLRQFFLPIICALRVSRIAKGELGSMGFSGPVSYTHL